MECETNDKLQKDGLIADLQYKTSKVKAEELKNRDAIESKRLEFSRNSIELQLAAKQATVDQLPTGEVESEPGRSPARARREWTECSSSCRWKLGNVSFRSESRARRRSDKAESASKIAETQAKDIQG